MLGFNIQAKIDTLEEARKALETIHESREMSIGPSGIKKLKGFDKEDMLNKAKKDAVFFEHLYDVTIANENPAVKQAYSNLITEAMLIAGEILQEADVAPRTVSPVIDNQLLTEDEAIVHYKRAFNLILEEQFNKPNLKSEILFEADDKKADNKKSDSKSKAKKDDNSDAGNQCITKRIVAPGVNALMVKCAKNGVLDNNDPEAVAKYLTAENAVQSAISNTLIPNRVMNQISGYQNNLPGGYSDLFGNTIGDKINSFNGIIAKIAAIVAPFMFQNALQNAGVSVPFNPVQVAGIGLNNDNADDGDTLSN